MCGIAGIIAEKGLRPDKDVLEKMVGAISHRGPDEGGFFFRDEAALGARRLSIIDLARGSQPRSSPCGRYHIVFNGEIYNYLSLRPVLEKKGYVFSSDSDTEVVLAAYAMYGAECPLMLDGMFAFAVWDSADRRLFLARDRLGVKPLYYADTGGAFIFASEIKAVAAYPGVERKINLQALDNYFTFGFSLCPETFIKNIHQVMPGHYITVSLDSIEQHEYWDLDFSRPENKISADDASEKLRFLLEDAVRKRLVSDVPVASYLSGGIDSSAVTGMYSGLGHGKIKSFSICFDHPDHNESRYAAMVSEYFGTDHTSFSCSPGTDDFRDMIWYLEEPMMTLLNLPLFSLSRKVREHGFKVVLSGDGSDELFGGYDYFKIMKILFHVMPLGGNSKKINLFSRINPLLRNESECRNFYAYLAAIFAGTPACFKCAPYVYSIGQLRNGLFSADVKREIDALPGMSLPFSPEKLKDMPLIQQMFYLEVKMRLLNLTLMLSDKMSMANSVELRSPFLDYKIAEFAATLPVHMKISGLDEKYILKKTLKNFLPEEIIQRKKQPLSAPAGWFIEKSRDFVNELTSDHFVRDKGYFNPDYVSRIRNNLSGNDENSQVIALMICFIHLWDELFL